MQLCANFLLIRSYLHSHLFVYVCIIFHLFRKVRKHSFPARLSLCSCPCFVQLKVGPFAEKESVKKLTGDEMEKIQLEKRSAHSCSTWWFRLQTFRIKASKPASLVWAKLQLAIWIVAKWQMHSWCNASERPWTLHRSLPFLVSILDHQKESLRLLLSLWTTSTWV